MSDTYSMFKKVQDRITEGKEKALSGTSPEFQDLVKKVTALHSVTKTGIEKTYKQALKEGVPSEFFKKYDKDLKKVIKAELLPHFYYEIDRVKEYQYEDSYYRRNFRSSDYCQYIHLINTILDQFIRFSALGADMYDYLSENVSEEVTAYKNQYGSSRFNFVIAALIDSGDRKICKTIEDTVLGSGGNVSIDLIRSIFVCKDVKMYELMEKLLLAARLQEGLRQAVCENMDYGTMDAFNYIYKVILDNDLMRFSSVQRAVEMFTGLVSGEEKGGDRINKKQSALIYQYLTDPSALEKAFSSNDHMEIYLGLWAIGTASIEDACKKALELVYEGNREQKLTAAFFLKSFSNNAQDSLKILSKFSDETDLVAIIMSSFMVNIGYAISLNLKEPDAAYREFTFRRVYANPELYFNNETQAREAYDVLKKIMENLPKKKIEYEGIVFPWYKVTLSKTDCVSRMAYCASAAKDQTLTLEVARDITSVETYARDKALALLLNEPVCREEYEILTKAVGDAEEYTRDRAFRMLKHELERDTSDLDPEIASVKGQLPVICYSILEDLLRLKRADARQNTITLLMSMTDDDKVELIGRLLSDKSEEKRTAALDMIMQMKKDHAPVFAKASEKLAVLTSPTTKEQVLIDEIISSSEDSSSGIEEGFGIFDPNASYEPVFDMKLIEEGNKVWDRVFPNKKIGGKKPDKKNKIDDFKVFKELDDLIEKNKDLEYEVWNGTRLLGNEIYESYSKETDTYSIPFPELWDEFYDKSVKSEDQLLRLDWILIRDYRKLDDINGFLDYCNKYVEEFFGSDYKETNLKKLKHYDSFSIVINYLIGKHAISELKADIGRAIAYHMIKSDDPMIFSFTKADLIGNARTNLEREELTRTPICDDVFSFFVSGIPSDSKSFPIKYALVDKFDGDYFRDNELWRYSTRNSRTGKMNTPDIGSYISACANGLISKDFLYKRFFDGFEKETLELLSTLIIFIRERDDAKSTRLRTYSYRTNYAIRAFLGKTFENKPIDPKTLTESDMKLLELAEECYETFIPFIVGKELKRGDSPTDYSAYIHSVNRLYGLEFFVGILKAFGKSTFNRSRYGYSNNDSKEAVLSHLLAVCVPDSRDGDVKEQAQKLKEMIKGTDIRDQRLIEAALFSPEWLDIIGEFLGFDGFRSGCYYFMAHMNEDFDEKRKAAIAKYSPISADEFNAGAFDSNWFKEVYSVLGEKRFDEIYDAAKYISDGAKHARARKYADAATGKLDAGKTREEIEKKRNKDLLMAYAIIQGSDADIRDRYCYIRQFIKESRKFGAQRRASEKLAGETAIKNMATAQGYQDETRFILKMENEIATGLASFWAPHAVGDVEMCLYVDEGKVSTKVVKGGKELKSVPAAIKKDDYVLELQEAKQTFTEQYRRTRIMFEEAMESRTVFTVEEIDALKDNPVLTDMIDSLVFECGGDFGLWKDLKKKKGSDVYIVHPYTLFKAGVWKDMQKLIFDNEIVQPFKQVFRELYVKTDEEKNCLDSRRYAGNQIQTKKTVGVLKSRRWIADVEDGLQKVYYKENIIATIYALADWFSPSDIEEPTLEWVAFYDRKTGERIKIADVPDILFSEVMRDVDLAVSVAHAGGVDPEMSHSTVEMRRAIAEFTCKSFKLKNVSFTATHALIKGERASYNVHLGSGVIHLDGGLMINVLPVHSQRRGRIFLPFVDDDPKTAEIISKILLFADDSKIKDPFILDQIV